MRIIGVDPGTRVAGYGIVEVNGNAVSGIAAGVWRLNAASELHSRLGALAIEFRRAVDLYSPTHLCLELAFLGENVRSALFLGHARGVILSEASQLGLSICEISATSAKKTITNHGRADKAAVAGMISKILGIDVSKLPFDATDALGLAYAQAVILLRETSLQTRSTELAIEQMQILEEWQQGRRKTARGNVRKGFAALLKAR